MAFFVDGNKTGPENFLDLVVHSNPDSLYIPGRVNLTEPTVDQNGFTHVTVSAKPGLGFTLPNVEVSYKRLSPVYASGTQSKGDIQLEDKTYTQQELKDLIIEHYELVGGDVNIVGFGAGNEIVVPENFYDDNEDIGYRITSKPGSYIYEDVTYPYFDGSFIGVVRDIPLTTLIPNNVLVGYTSR